jgi:hypothetical protein
MSTTHKVLANCCLLGAYSNLINSCCVEGLEGFLSVVLRNHFTIFLQHKLLRKRQDTRQVICVCRRMSTGYRYGRILLPTDWADWALLFQCGHGGGGGGDNSWKWSVGSSVARSLQIFTATYANNHGHFHSFHGHLSENLPLHDISKHNNNKKHKT